MIGVNQEIHLELTIDGDPAPAKVDADRMAQVFNNLISNAIKYTDRGSVSLTLRYRSQVAEFTVRDSGEGIAEENIERIFRPFERIRLPGESRVGTGLGLTITRLLTEIMGGDISVQPAPAVFNTGQVMRDGWLRRESHMLRFTISRQSSAARPHAFLVITRANDGSG